jgi:hypothetical protein
MGSEYFINSQTLEDQVRKLLPSQGGAGAGFDLSASTQIIPIIDLTESAEGSNVRQDLQSAFSFGNTNVFSIINATNTSIITNTGYYRVKGTVTTNSASGTVIQTLQLFDGATRKVIIDGNIALLASNSGMFPALDYDFLVFLGAGDSLEGTSSTTTARVRGIFRQIADIDGNLVQTI